ncbi:MAG TPA: TRAFs-binding domain-containing protein [Pyrinomonadaceae bacterium]|nr:TRAFs-binding domain-containing protein [Pyrinomonadaceae bacterium]
MPEEKKKVCFVVMGYGKKTDYQSGRVLDLDASYRNMIKPAVQKAGLECIRADEIVHSGTIDTPMYKQLLEADVVIADLSTANPNAFYELGVRHALRPFTTIIVAEEKLGYPFDVNHTVIRRYKHLGDDIGVGDAQRFTAEIVKAIKEIMKKAENDSPVYTYLKGLKPPMMTVAEELAAGKAKATGKKAALGKRGGPARASKKSRSTKRRASRAGAAAVAPANETLSVLLGRADEAQASGDFAGARQLLLVAREMMRPKDDREEDPYLVQRLALVTYKSKQPTPKKALEKARDLLLTLKPDSSNDTETLGLWGAVHKRLWEETGNRKYLDEAVRAYERGFFLRNDYYNGINFAYLLNVRSAVRTDKGEAIADFVQAQRIRREVITICEQYLKSELPPSRRDGKDTKYWVLATLAEASLGIGDQKEAKKWLKKAYSAAPHSWMKTSTDEQLDKLKKLLEKSPLKAA